MPASDQDRSVSETPRDNVRDRLYPPTVGPHYRNLLLVAAALLILVGVALFWAPRSRAPEPEAARAAPPPKETFLDRALPRRPEDPEDAGRWWDEIDVTAPDPLHEVPTNEVPGTLGEPFGPTWPEDPTGLPALPAYAPAPPSDPRAQAYERALKSASLRPAVGSTAVAKPGSEPDPREVLAELQRATVGLLPQTLTPRSPLPRAGEGMEEKAGPELERPVSSPPASPSPATRERGNEGVRVRAGTLIPARLETALDSDTPGPVLARVVRDVLAADGHTVAIPAGALLLGSVDRDLALGGNRMLVGFERLVTPDGSLELPQLEALDAAGPRGLADQVDRHTWGALGKAVLLGALGAGFQLSQPQRSERATLSSGELVSSQMALELYRVAQEIVGRDLSRRPTVKVRTGERFQVFVTQDLELAGGPR